MTARVVVLAAALALILEAIHISAYGPLLEVALLAKVMLVEDLVMTTATLIIQEIQAVAVALEQLVLVAVIPIPLLMAVLALNILYLELPLITLEEVEEALPCMMVGQVLVLATAVLAGVVMAAALAAQLILEAAVAVVIKVKMVAPVAVA